MVSNGISGNECPDPFSVHRGEELENMVYQSLKVKREEELILQDIIEQGWDREHAETLLFVVKATFPQRVFDEYEAIIQEELGRREFRREFRWPQYLAEQVGIGFMLMLAGGMIGSLTFMVRNSILFQDLFNDSNAFLFYLVGSLVALMGLGRIIKAVVYKWKFRKLPP